MVAFAQTSPALLARLPSMPQRRQFFFSFIPSMSIAVMIARQSDRIDGLRSVLMASLSFALFIFSRSHMCLFHHSEAYFHKRLLLRCHFYLILPFYCLGKSAADGLFSPKCRPVNIVVSLLFS